MIKFAQALNRLVFRLTLTAFTVSVAIITVQIVLRYVFNFGLIGGEELARYLNIFMALLGSSIVFLEDSHPRFETLFEMLPDRYRNWLAFFFTALTSLFLALLAWQGIGLCVFAWEDFTSALGIRWTFPYLAIPVGAVLMLFQVIVRYRIDYHTDRE